MGLALAYFTTGCLVIPTPPVHSGYARTNVTEETTTQFERGKNTMADVILQLGEPDAVSADESRVVYRSEKLAGLWAVGAGGDTGAAAGDAGALFTERIFIIEFDSSGRFQSARRTWQIGIVDDFGPPVLKPLALPSKTTGPPMAGGEIILREQPHAFWLPGAAGRLSIGEPGRLVFTKSHLVFYTAGQFANAEPALKLPFDEIVDARVNGNLFSGKWLLVNASNGVHSFRIERPKQLGAASWEDKAAMQAACNFIRFRIK